MNIESAATIGFGLLFIASGIYINYNYRRFAENSQEAEALVLDVEIVKTKRSTTYYPTVRFKTMAGEEITARLREFRPVKAGDKTLLCYQPDKPDNASIGPASDLIKTGRGALVLCLIFGAGVCLIGLNLHFEFFKWLPKR